MAVRDVSPVDSMNADVKSRYHSRVAVTEVPPSMTAEEAFVQLRGRVLKLPDFRALMAGWPFEVHSGQERAREDLELLLQHMSEIDPEKTTTIKGIRKGNVAMFGAALYSNASYEKMLAATEFCVWLWVFDDEIDHRFNGCASQDRSEATRFRTEAEERVRRCLEVAPYSSMDTQEGHPVLNTFKQVGDKFMNGMSACERQNFVNAIKFWLDSCDEEQRLKLNSEIPPLDVFWKLRMGTSAVRTLTAILQWSLDIELTEEVQSSTELFNLFEAVNALISISNDLFSSKKEIATGCSHNLLVVLFNEEQGNYEAAVERCGDMYRTYVQVFDESAEKLLTTFGTAAPALEKIVKGCRNLCTGNIIWSEATKRYGVVREENGDQVLFL